MKPVDSTGTDENQDVTLFRKCTDKSIRKVADRSSQNAFSLKKKNALLSNVAYDNVYSNKSIFRRKLIEKYSSARYNFNTKRINSVPIVLKKRFNHCNFSSGRCKSKNNRAVAVKNFAADLPAQSANSSFFDGENSDSCESTYLTVSYNSDSDSRLSLMSDECSEVPYESAELKNAASPTLHGKFNSESTEKAETVDVEKSTAKQPDTDYSEIVKNAEFCFDLKRSHTSASNFTLSNSDADSGLQLCTDGGKCCPDQLQSEGQKVDFTQLLMDNVEKSHKQLQSFQNTSDWVYNSSQNPCQLNLNTDSNTQASSTEIISSDCAVKHPSSASCAISSDVSVDAVSTPKIAETSFFDGDKSEMRNTHNSGATFSEPITKWRLVPSTIYQHLAEHYEIQRKDTQMPDMPKKRRRKGTRKNQVGPTKRSFLTRKVSDEPTEIPCPDPFDDTLDQLKMGAVSTDEHSSENLGMILHVGVNRPLFPEIYRNIITLNEMADGQITDLWANFALTTLITDKASKRFRSVFLPVIDTKLKSTIVEYQRKTCCDFQEVNLQKVKFLGSPKEENTDRPLGKNICTRERKNALNSNHQSCENHLDENSIPPNRNSSPDVKKRKTACEYSMPAADYSELPVKKLSDEALLAKHGYKPCWVLLPRIQIPCSKICPETEEDDDNEHHFFDEDHCSRTHGQMFDYRSRNLSLIFFHRIKRILRLQKQNNKLFHSCVYVQLQSDIKDELNEVDLLDDCLDTIDDFKPLSAAATENPLDIFNMWKLDMFEAPLLKGIDVNACKFPIRFVNHQSLKSEINVKWFILQLNKCLLNVTYQGKDCLPSELLFQIICRADLSKKVVCHTIGVEFNPNVLNFGIYGVPGLCEAVLVGPYENKEMQHNLVATIQLWNGETAHIPLLETSFDLNTFFLWNEDTKMRSVYGLWWKPGGAVPCTSVANSDFMNRLFNPTKTEWNNERSVKVRSLLSQHPCLTYRKYQRGSHDVNIRLVHQALERSCTATGPKVSERMAVENFIVDDSPLLQPTKLRSRTNMPNYCETVSPKMRIYEFTEPKNMQASRVPAGETIKSLERDENMLKRTKRGLLFKRKKLIIKLRANMRQFPSNHPCYRNSSELILNLSKCDRAENFSQSGVSKVSDDSSHCVVTAAINSDDVRPIEPSEEPSFKSSEQCPISESNKAHSISKLSKPHSITESNKQNFTKKQCPAAVSRHSRPAGDVSKCLRGKVVESRLQSHEQPFQQPLPPAFKNTESSSLEGILGSEHTYAKRSIGSRLNNRWASSGIPLKERQKQLTTFLSPSVRCDEQATDSSNESDQVAAYLTESDLGLPIIEQSYSLSLQNSITLTNSPAHILSDTTDLLRVTNAATIIDEQLSVENQIILNPDGDQIDISTYIDYVPLAKPSKRGRRPASFVGQSKLTAFEGPNDAVAADNNEATDNSFPKSPSLDLVNSGKKSSQSEIEIDSSNRYRILPLNRNKVGCSSLTVNQSSNQRMIGSSSAEVNWRLNRSNVDGSRPKINFPLNRSYIEEHFLVHRGPNGKLKLMRDMLESPIPAVSPETRLYGRNTFSSPNYHKLVFQRRINREALSPVTVVPIEAHKLDCKQTDPKNGNYFHVAGSSVEEPSSLKKSLVTRFRPNILTKNYEAKGSLPNRRRVSLPLGLDKRFTGEERLRCPSFVPPSVHRTSLLVTVAEKEVPIEMESPVEESAVDFLVDDMIMKTVDDLGLCVENGSPTDEEPSMSRRSSLDSSTRLGIKSFASVHSFNDNCFNNMGRMLKF